MKIEDCRDEIDIIDAEIAGLFLRRMEIVARIAAIKKTSRMHIVNPKRETEILERIRKLAPNNDMVACLTSLFEKIISLSSAYQAALLELGDEVE